MARGLPGVKTILHVFSTFLPGGPQRRTVDLFNTLPQSFQHVVMALDGRHDAMSGVTAPNVICVDIPRGAGGRVDRAAFRKQLIANAPDLMITYNWGATEALQAVLFRSFAPILHAQDGFGPDEAAGQILRRLWARRFYYRFVEAVVVPSRQLEETATAQWWLPPRRVLYIPNGIDVNKFIPDNTVARAKFRAQWHIPADARVVGMVAHLRAEKSPARLLEGFARSAIEGSILLFIGDGPEREALLQRAKELKLADRVRFAGHMQDPSVAYPAMDAFSLCSNTEQMPVSVLEAMGSGLPVVSTNVGDVRSMVCPANQEFITTLGDDAAFAGALRSVLSDPALCARLGAANRSRCVSQFSLNQQINAYRDLYDRFSRPKAMIWRSEHYRNH